MSLIRAKAAGTHAPAAGASARFHIKPDSIASCRTGPSGLFAWRPVLKRLGISLRQMKAIEERASLAGVPFQVELLASGTVDETELYRELADYLGLEFVSEVQPETLFLRQRHCLEILRRPGGARSAVALNGSGQTTFLIAPDRLDIGAMQQYLRRNPDAARHMRMVSPSTLRQAVRDRAKESLLRIAINGLFEAMPSFSARFVLSAWQGVALGALAAMLAVSLILAPMSSLLAIHVFLSVLFLCCVMLRTAVSHSVRKVPPPVLLKAVRTAEMPVYTVLVALYKEAEIVPDLLVALGRLVWPRSKLEIKLVCESDDAETLAAIKAQKLHPCIEVIEVPALGPRTKPKALSFALPMTTGEFLVLYDAEDKPHPFQLVKAWQRFRDGGERLACIQAPLVTTNRRESWISDMFAFEYSALFRGILPWLATRNLVLPLGGTSNHFRRRILEEVGGWDPCNVTEDADLGLRLARYGYRTGTIGYPTYEDAPVSVGVWLPQRTRWFKGWAQTWFVHMRNAPQLLRDLGPASFLVAQVLTAGMFISALAYSAFALTIFGIRAYILSGQVPTNFHLTLLLIDIVNIVFGHGAFLMLGWRTLPVTERNGLWKHVLLTPLYWTLLSAAAWRALWQLYRCPHHWEKTPHRPSGLTSAAPASKSLAPSFPPLSLKDGMAE